MGHIFLVFAFRPGLKTIRHSVLCVYNVGL